MGPITLRILEFVGIDERKTAREIEDSIFGHVPDRHSARGGPTARNRICSSMLEKMHKQGLIWIVASDWRKGTRKQVGLTDIGKNQLTIGKIGAAACRK